MNPRLRKFLGTVMLMVYSAIYLGIAGFLTLLRPATTPLAAELAYHFIAAVIWMFPAALILRWMLKSGGGHNP